MVLLCVALLCLSQGQASLLEKLLGPKFSTENGEHDNVNEAEKHELEYKSYASVYPVYWKKGDCKPAVNYDRYLLMSKRNGG